MRTWKTLLGALAVFALVLTGCSDDTDGAADDTTSEAVDQTTDATDEPADEAETDDEAETEAADGAEAEDDSGEVDADVSARITAQIEDMGLPSEAAKCMGDVWASSDLSDKAKEALAEEGLEGLTPDNFEDGDTEVATELNAADGPLTACGTA